MTVEAKTDILLGTNPALEELRIWCRENYKPRKRTVICPYCSAQTGEKWQVLFTTTDSNGNALQFPHECLSHDFEDIPPTFFKLDWMICLNPECKALIVRVRESEDFQEDNNPKTWLAIPEDKQSVPIDDSIPHDFARDCREAWSILDQSPRMSSVLSRKILGDLLKQYAGADQYNLNSRIKAFIDDNRNPSRLRESLHYLREMGDFSAHTQTDVDGKIVEVSREEAEWTLKVIADLFDYFIVGPEKDTRLRAEFDKKLKQAGRKPIKTLAELKKDDKE